MEPAFIVESFQDPYLDGGARRVDAIVSIAATRVAAGLDNLMLGFVIDTSASMQGGRLDAVRAAVRGAVDMLDERTRFFVVTFSNFARVVVPPCPATPAARASAVAALRRLTPSGGTAMSQGLGAARSLFSGRPDATRRCLFVTDGNNEAEHRYDLERELALDEGIFACDCWGIRAGWHAGEVDQIARRLHGEASWTEAEGDPVMFHASVARALAGSVHDVRVRVAVRAGTEVLAVKQVSPSVGDLTAHAVRIGPDLWEYSTGSWGAGDARDYQIAMRVAPGRPGEELLAARPSVVYRGQGGVDAEVAPTQAHVFARWTPTRRLATR